MDHHFQEHKNKKNNTKWEEDAPKICCTLGDIFDVPVEDEDNENIVQNARRKLETPAYPIMPCLTSQLTTSVHKMREETPHSKRERPNGCKNRCPTRSSKQKDSSTYRNVDGLAPLETLESCFEETI